MWLGNGVLFTRGPSTYKIPGFNDVPLDFRVELLADAPNPRAIHSSKGVGEPPLFLSASVFFGILPLFLPTLTPSHPSHSSYPLTPSYSPHPFLPLSPLLTPLIPLISHHLSSSPSSSSPLFPSLFVHPLTIYKLSVTPSPLRAQTQGNTATSHSTPLRPASAYALRARMRSLRSSRRRNSSIYSFCFFTFTFVLLCYCLSVLLQ